MNGSYSIILWPLLGILGAFLFLQHLWFLGDVVRTYHNVDSVYSTVINVKGGVVDYSSSNCGTGVVTTIPELTSITYKQVQLFVPKADTGVTNYSDWYTLHSSTLVNCLDDLKTSFPGTQVQKFLEGGVYIENKQDRYFLGTMFYNGTTIN